MIDPTRIREAVEDAVDDVLAIKDHPTRTTAAADLHRDIGDIVGKATADLAAIAVPGPEVDPPG